MTEDEILEAAARIICRKNGWRYYDGNDERMVTRDYQSCTRAKKTGDRCGRHRVHWPEHADLPDPRACRTHLTDPERALLDAEIARLNKEAFAVEQVPACWNWPAPQDCTFKTADDADRFLRWWNKRCAVCDSDRELVLDHDHETALVRGYICRSCNRQETYWGSDSLIGRYRLRTPAIILGIYVRYSGWGGEAVPAPPRASGSAMRAAVDMLTLPSPRSVS